MKSLIPRSQAETRLPSTRALIEEAIGHVCTCAVLHVRQAEQVIFEGAFGRRAPNGPAGSTDSLFDLASLTKVFVSTALLALFDRRCIALEDPIVSIIPEFAGRDARRKRVTLAHLLTHTSGLPAYVNFRAEVGAKAVIARVCATPLSHSPGAAVLYSDLGFMLLGEAVVRLSGDPLEQAVSDLVCGPLELGDVLFQPPRQLHRRIVCTENDAWRKRVLRGEVHDENCWAMGGVAGHAGLFGTASSVAQLGEAYRLSGALGLRRVLSRASANDAIREHAVGQQERRGWGWALKSNELQSCGRYFSMRSFGHTGYTGTSLWVDPEQALTVAFLTNRVHCSRDPDAIFQLRVAVHEAIVSDLRGVRDAAAR